MKRLLVILVVMAGLLTACFPALTDPSVVVQPAQAPWTHAFRVKVAGVFVAASSAPIVAVEGPNCQLRATLVGGPNSAVSCDAPGSYRLQTTGSVSAGVVRR